MNRAPGVQAVISAPATLAFSDYERLQFQGWSDGGPVERVWTAAKDAQTLAANFTTSYRVLAQSNPANGSTFTYNPASADGFYPANSYVTVTASPKPGYTFRSWDGQTQLSPSIQVRLYAPQAFTANLGTYPYAEGVFNSAGATPEADVAPGSIIAIRGVSLAGTTANGPANPLAQTISGVTVMVNGRLLPMFSVSPSEIDAQLPSDFADGTYSLTVQRPASRMPPSSSA